MGARRSGKSTALMNLVSRLFDHFKMVIAFVGSAACCPTLEALMDLHPSWDSAFFFDHWNQPLVDKLLEQQQELRRRGVKRPVLILMDDVILTSKAADQLSHMAMRGRHFDVSLMMAAVSYTSVSKRARRSLDYLLCFGCPMTGDRKVLSWEYAQNARLADFGLKKLREHECLVFETGKSALRNWRAELVTIEQGRIFFGKGKDETPAGLDRLPPVPGSDHGTVQPALDDADGPVAAPDPPERHSGLQGPVRLHDVS